MVRGKLSQSSGKAQGTRKQAGKASILPSPSQVARRTSPYAAPSCCSCGAVVNDDTKALQCDRCVNPDIWKCAKCLNLTNDMYDCLVSDTGVPLRWFCENCDKIAMSGNSSIPTPANDKMDNLISAIEKLMNRYEDVEKKLASKCNYDELSKLEQRIEHIEQRIAKYDSEMVPKILELDDQIRTTAQPQMAVKDNGISDEDLIKIVVKEEINKKTDEERDLERRKRNVIIYRVPEKQTENVSERKANDVVFVKDLLDGIFDTKIEENDIDKLYRLGHWEEGKARPLLVSFTRMEHKEIIMSNLRELKRPLDRFKGIGIAHDMHPKEREENRRMVNEAKQEHEANGESSENFRFLVVGRGLKKKVIKLKNKTFSA